MNKHAPSKPLQNPKQAGATQKKPKKSKPLSKTQSSEISQEIPFSESSQEIKHSKISKFLEKIAKNKIFNFIKSLFWWTILPVMLVIIGYALNESSIPTHLKNFGILSQDFANILGKVFSPFIHNSLDHLISNIISLWTLLLLLALFYKRFYWRVLGMVLLFSELFIWIIGARDAYRGSSSIIYGLAAFIFFSGFFQKRTAAIFASFMIFAAYYTLITELFPQQNSTTNNIPYSIHWSGVLSGLMIAVIINYFSFWKEKLRFRK